MALSEPGGGSELELRAYLDILHRRWRTIAITVGILVVIAVGSSARETKQYTATADVLIEQRATDTILSTDTNSALANLQNADRKLNNEVRSLNSGITKAAVEKAYDGPLDPDDVNAVVSAALSDAVTVSVTAPDPSEAAKLVNTYVDTYIKIQRNQRIDELADAGSQIQQQADDLATRIASVRAPLTRIEDQLAANPGNRDLESRRDDLAASLEADLQPLETQRAFYQQMLEDLRVSAGIAGTGGARVLTPAKAPVSPVSPKPFRSGVLALVVGLFLGIGIAFVRDTLDERIRGMDDLARAAPGIPPLAAVPESRTAERGFVAMRDDPTSAVAEAFRSLRTSVKFAGLDTPIRVVQVTSALPGEGKTTTVANLAEAIAQGGERVAVVCCDMRRPRIHQSFGVNLTPGFTDVLLQTAPLARALHRVSERLFVLPAGSPPPNPSELLSSSRAADVIKALADEFDVVVIDSTPVLPVTDALVVSRLVDATLVVVDTRGTKRRALHTTLERLEQVSAPVVGLVLNGVVAGGGYNYGYGYGYGYGESSGEDDRSEPQRLPISVHR